MIRSEHQAQVAKRKLAGLQASRDAMKTESDRRAYDDLIRVAKAAIDEYEEIKAGEVLNFNVGSVDELGDAAIKARLAKGLTQKQLAELLNVTEQMVQKDESRAYEVAGVAKLADVLDVLGYELVGCVRPARGRVIPLYYEHEDRAQSSSVIESIGEQSSSWIQTDPSRPVSDQSLAPLTHGGKVVTAMGPRR